MIKVFIPQDKTQGKTNIRGLWVNNEGRLFYDYLKENILNWDLERGNYRSRFYSYLEDIKIQYKQEAIFYTYKNKGFIYYSRDKIEILTHRIYAMIGRNFKVELKEDLKLYGGVTIYKIGAYYCKEIFY